MIYKLKQTLANDFTGGYPRVLQLTDTVIDRLAQKYTNQQFRFKIVD